MTLLQLRTALALISTDYDDAAVFIESSGESPEARAVYLFAQRGGPQNLVPTVWVTDEQSSRTDPPPDLVIVPGSVIV